VINVNEDSVMLLCSFKGEYEPVQSLSLSQDEGERCWSVPKAI